MKRFLPGVGVFDALVLLLVAAAAVIADTGGGVWRIAGTRVSMQQPWNPLAYAGVLLLARLWVYGRVGPFGRSWRAIGATFGIARDVPAEEGSPVPAPRELALALAALIVAVSVVFHGQVADLYSVPDLGDPLFSMWRMAWVSRQIIADPAHLFDANIFYPSPAALTFSDSMILPALTAAPLLWAGVHPVVAYNLLFLSGFALSGLAAYVLARSLGLGMGASWIAALINCFYPYRIDHYSHLELQMAQWAPIVLLAVYRLLLRGGRAYVVVLTLAVAAQWYSSMYYGVFLMAYAGAFAAVLSAVCRPGWRRVGHVAAGLALGVALAWPLARAYSASTPVRGTRPVDAIRRFSAEPIDYLQPSDRSAWYGSFEAKERLIERELFPGFVPLVCSVAGVWPPLSTMRLAIAAAGLVAFDGSLGLNGHWYPIAYRIFSPLASLRAPARFAIFVGLSLAILSAFGIERLSRRIASIARRRRLIAALTAAVVVDVWPSIELQPVWRDPPPMYASLPQDGGAVLFEYPLHPKPDWFAENLPYMYFSIWHWQRMVNGYSGSMPQSYRTIVESTAGFPNGQTVDYLRRIGVTHVTVNCALWNDDACRQVNGQLEADPRFRLERRTPWHTSDTWLYELRR